MANGTKTISLIKNQDDKDNLKCLKRPKRPILSDSDQDEDDFKRPKKKGHKVAISDSDDDDDFSSTLKGKIYYFQSPSFHEYFGLS